MGFYLASFSGAVPDLVMYVLEIVVHLHLGVMTYVDKAFFSARGHQRSPPVKLHLR